MPAVTRSGVSSRSRVTFRLRTLLIGMALVAALLAWLAKPLGREIRWLLAIYPVGAAGGSVAWSADAVRAPETVASIDLTNSRITDVDLRVISRFPNAKTLLLTNTQITDAAVEHLGDLRSLEWLDLRGTQITPLGIAKLRSALPTTEIGY